MLNTKAAMAGPVRRRCERCSAFLSRNNFSNVCSPCQRAELQESRTKLFGLAEMGLSE